MKCYCDQCGRTYAGGGGGHCRGGRYGGCCQTFGGNDIGDRHRVGPWDRRRCLTPDEMRERGWHQDAEGVWRRPVRAKPEHWA